MNAAIEADLRQVGQVPAAIVTDAAGKVLLARWGLPTVSDLAKLLAAESKRPGVVRTERTAHPIDQMPGGHVPSTGPSSDQDLPLSGGER